MSADTCFNVIIAEDQHTIAVANDYVVLGFILCFIVSAILVIIFVKYVIKQLSVERERERNTTRRKVLRMQAARSTVQLSEVDNNSFETQPLHTNYLSSANEVVTDKVDLTEERSHSRITLMIEDVHHSDLKLAGGDLLDTLATLFTSSQNSLPPTVINHCFDFMQTCFEQILSFHREAFSVLLHLMLGILFEEKRINEMDKLQMVARYEQLLDEPVKTSDLVGYTNKLHFVLAKLEKEINSMISQEEESQATTFNGKKLSKYMMVVQRELLDHDCKEIVKEMFTLREYGLANAIMDKWFHLEVTRYRINVIHEAVETVLEKNNKHSDISKQILDKYVENVYHSLESFCQDYEKDLFTLVDKVKKDIESQSKQAFIELEMLRLGQRSEEIRKMDHSNRKAVSKFVVSQIDSIINDLKTFTNYKIILQTESLDIVADFQKLNEKKVTQLLKKCEEQLFESLQNNEVMDEENISELGKELSMKLKDFKKAQEQLKIEILCKIKDEILTVSEIAKSAYELTQRKIEKGIGGMKNESLEAFHSLSNLTESDMNQLEHEFEVAFSSLAFGFQFAIMSGFVTTIHNSLSTRLDECKNKDLSFSLHDMVNILKQDKTVLKRSSLYQPLDPGFYVAVATEFYKVLQFKSIYIDDQLNIILSSINQFILPKIDSLLQNTSLRQLNCYVKNLYIAKDKLLAASMDSKGYTSSSASTFTKNCFDLVVNVWESQANFKSHKLKEEKTLTMKDFDPKIDSYFYIKDGAKHFDKEFQEFNSGFQSELNFYKKLENQVRENSVEGVIDCNLENEIMIAKFEDKLGALESRTNAGYDEDKGKKWRNPGSRRSKLVEDKKASPRRQNLKHSISQKKKL